MSNNASKGSNSMARTIVIAVTVVVVIAIIAVTTVIVLKSKASSASNDNDAKYATGNAFAVTEDNKGTAADIRQKVEDGMITVKMTGEWTFNKDCSSSNAYIANSEHNNYPLRVTVYDANTNEELFTMPDMEVGQCMENFGLPVMLEPGEHDIIISHQTVKNGQVYSTVNTAGKITVLSE